MAINWRQEADNIINTDDLLENIANIIDDISTKEDYSSKPIKVKGTNDKKLKDWVRNLDDFKQNIFYAMENHPALTFAFDSLTELELHLKIRSATVNRMLELERAWNGNHNSIANYPSGNESFKVPAGYWDFLNVPGESRAFITPERADLGNAIQSLMKQGNGILLDCNRMSVAVVYNGLLDGLGKADINKLFSKMDGVILGSWIINYPNFGRISLLAHKYYEKDFIDTASSKSPDPKLCLPGDIVYFKNTPLYKKWAAQIERYIFNPRFDAVERTSVAQDDRFTTAWSGEYCVCTGMDKFAGFGLRDKSQIEFSAQHIGNTLFQRTLDLQHLIREKIANVEQDSENSINLAEIGLDNVCYRLNSSNILTKLSK